jgi:hypothetical protein
MTVLIYGTGAVIVSAGAGVLWWLRRQRPRGRTED